jgi:hypothetical protein
VAADAVGFHADPDEVVGLEQIEGCFARDHSSGVPMVPAYQDASTFQSEPRPSSAVKNSAKQEVQTLAKAQGPPRKQASFSLRLRAFAR